MTQKSLIKPGAIYCRPIQHSRCDSDVLLSQAYSFLPTLKVIAIPVKPSKKTTITKLSVVSNIPSDAIDVCHVNILVLYIRIDIRKQLAIIFSEEVIARMTEVRKGQSPRRVHD